MSSKLKILGALKSVTLRKSGHDDWMVDSVNVRGDGVNSTFAFNGQKISKAGVTVKA